MFERGLRRLAAQASYPPTPELRARVVAAIAAEQSAATHGRERARVAISPTNRIAWALAAMLVAAVVGLAVAVPGSRHAVADFFGISGSHIEILPTPAPGVTPTPFPTPAGIQSYATPSSLIDVRRDHGFEPALPPGWGEPKGVYIADYLGAFPVVLQYDAFDLWEVQLSGGTFNKGVPIQGVFDKSARSGTVIENLTINGNPAVWIAGGEHIVRYVDAEGRTVDASVRTVERNTLVWHNDSFFYRLETDLPKADAIRIAKSLP